SGPASSSVATRATVTAGSPRRRQPCRTASVASARPIAVVPVVVMAVAPAAPPRSAAALFEALLERAEDLRGDVDGLADIECIADDQVVALVACKGFDLPEEIHAQLAEFLVAADVHILPQLLELPLQIALVAAEIILGIAPLLPAHDRSILLELLRT